MTANPTGDTDIDHYQGRLIAAAFALKTQAEKPLHSRESFERLNNAYAEVADSYSKLKALTT